MRATSQRFLPVKNDPKGVGKYPALSQSALSENYSERPVQVKRNHRRH
jgi:hypothetical protein